MFTHILVPLDGSERSEQAVPLAVRIARSTGARVTLQQAVSIPTPMGAPDAGPATGVVWLAQGQANAATYLARVAAWPLMHGLGVDTSTVVGAAAANILEAAQEHQVDLIMLCSHGRTGPSRWALGSVAEQVARHSTVPVLLLRAGMFRGADESATAERVTRILVPLDGSRFAEAALMPASALVLALAEPGQAAMRLTLVLAPYEADQSNLPAALALEGASTYLMRVADRMRGACPQLGVSWSVTADLDTAGALLRIAAGDETGPVGTATHCDLIAMATHGRSGIARWALGSVTERVLHDATVPVCIIRPHAEAMGRQPDQAEVAHSLAASHADGAPAVTWSR
jgi:nucleotide-binding universal stress UspA family protein